MAGPGKAQSPPGPGNGLTYPFTPFNTMTLSVHSMQDDNPRAR